MKGLAKQPAERYDDCASFARAVLGEVPEGLPEDTKVQSAAAPAEPRVSQGEAGRVRCPVCSKGIAFGPKHAGRSIRCPKCETKRRVGNNLRSLTEVVPVTESTTGPADATMQLGAVETVKVAANRDDPGVAPPIPPGSPATSVGGLGRNRTLIVGIAVAGGSTGHWTACQTCASAEDV